MEKNEELRKNLKVNRYAKAQARYFDKLADIAEREDAFKHEVAEYVASLQSASNNEEIHFEH